MVPFSVFAYVQNRRLDLWSAASINGCRSAVRYSVGMSLHGCWSQQRVLWDFVWWTESLTNRRCLTAIKSHGTCILQVVMYLNFFTHFIVEFSLNNKVYKVCLEKELWRWVCSFRASICCNSIWLSPCAEVWVFYLGTKTRIGQQSSFPPPYTKTVAIGLKA